MATVNGTLDRLSQQLVLQVLAACQWPHFRKLKKKHWTLKDFAVGHTHQKCATPTIATRPVELQTFNGGMRTMLTYLSSPCL